MVPTLQPTVLVCLQGVAAEQEDSEVSALVSPAVRMRGSSPPVQGKPHPSHVGSSLAQGAQCLQSRRCGAPGQPIPLLTQARPPSHPRGVSRAHVVPGIFPGAGSGNLHVVTEFLAPSDIKRERFASARLDIEGTCWASAALAA